MLRRETAGGLGGLDLVGRGLSSPSPRLRGAAVLGLHATARCHREMHGKQRWWCLPLGLLAAIV